MILFNSFYENYHHMTFFFLTYYFLECRATFTVSEKNLSSTYNFIPLCSI